MKHFTSFIPSKFEMLVVITQQSTFETLCYLSVASSASPIVLLGIVLSLFNIMETITYTTVDCYFLLTKINQVFSERKRKL